MKFLVEGEYCCIGICKYV